MLGDVKSGKREVRTQDLKTYGTVGGVAVLDRYDRERTRAYPNL